MDKPTFNTGEPLAYFLTWITYATWLPGDERGWNRKGEHESLPWNMAKEESAIGDLKETPFFLTPTDRSLVKRTIRKHCEVRGWELHAVNVRSNHAHVVVTAPHTKPETTVAQFKAWCTRKLKPSYPDREQFGRKVQVRGGSMMMLAWRTRSNTHWRLKSGKVSSDLNVEN